MKNDYDLIITIINQGYSDYVIDAAREAGATGGTIVYARGSSENGTNKFLGVTIQPEKELVLTIVEHDNKNKIMKSICDKTNLDEKGRGICFSMPISKVIGLAQPKK